MVATSPKHPIHVLDKPAIFMKTGKNDALLRYMVYSVLNAEANITFNNDPYINAASLIVMFIDMNLLLSDQKIVNITNIIIAVITNN